MMYIVALILLAMTVILALTLPHLKTFQPTREHAEVLFALIYAPAFTSIVILLGGVVVNFIKLVNGE
ncbi:hypothetical protein INF23_05890 [Ligilactobacillus salivarius]|uniref:hypothetical protein n=1 Tax=Ligilactobacillus salivarius TaxID=1624 RepID=UPI001875739A|nr:hypothetical protein [Ligilactobacillus salivarius]MBE5067136.1 hypothetical protein [Ligilactobacillus salivarius]